MSNVVSINDRKFLGGYSSSQANERVPEGTMFIAGVLLTMIVPVISYCSYGGPVPPIVFACAAMAGTIGGMIKHNLELHP